MLDDVCFGRFIDISEVETDGYQGLMSTPSQQIVFEQLLKDARHSLYLGCANFSKLSFTFKILHIKSIGNWIVKSFDIML